MLYDERGQGKGADALCSLRLRHHLAIAKQDTPPEILLMVLDDCVGQNKSQCVFQSYAALSLLFYKKIVLLFLLPGHSHNQADRVVAYCRNAMRKRNMYDPSTIADIWSDVKTVKAEFLSHTDGQCPFYIGWESLLSKYFMKMPPQYTRSFFFEIDGGLCSMHHLCSSYDEDVTTVQLIRPDNADDIRRALVKDLWGSDLVSLKEASITALKLTRTPNTELPQKKLESLAKKHFSIPLEYLSYYPNVSAELCVAANNECGSNTRSKETTSDNQVGDSKQKLAAGVAPPRRPGRPKKQSRILHNQPSILSFFSKSTTTQI